MLLSCSGKKVTKEAGTGEALTAKPIGTSRINPISYLGFEPPSPVYPFRPPSIVLSELLDNGRAEIGTFPP